MNKTTAKNIKKVEKMIEDGLINTDFKSNFMNVIKTSPSIHIEFLPKSVGLLIPNSDPLYQNFISVCKKFVKNHF